MSLGRRTFRKLSIAQEIAEAILRSRKGRAGLAIILFYVVLGTIGPMTTPYDPIASMNVADILAVPEWYAAITDPDLPRNIEKTFTKWKVVDTNIDEGVDFGYEAADGNLIVEFRGKGVGTVVFESEEYIDYPYNPAKSMLVSYNYTVYNLSTGKVWYKVVIYVKNLDLYGKNATITQGGETYIIPMGFYIVEDFPGFQPGAVFEYSDQLGSRGVSKRLPYYIEHPKQPYELPEFVNPVNELLLAKDTRVVIGINITYYCNPNDFIVVCSGDGLRFEFDPVNVYIYGLAYGLFGTTYLGADVWTQFVYGARVAIIFGISVALAIAAIGVVVGMVAGYYGGRKIDHILTYFIDVVYFIPALPLILAAGIVFGRSIFVIFIVLTLLSWPGSARLIRSWTLALRNETYVEVARSLGASTSRILFKHIFPQLTPLMVYFIVLDVPAAIFTEAAIQLIGFGDPGFPSWGKMLNEAFYGGAILSGAWWWLILPIAGIVTIALGFALIGLALDEIVNPRLRMRRMSA